MQAPPPQGWFWTSTDTTELKTHQIVYKFTNFLKTWEKINKIKVPSFHPLLTSLRSGLAGCRHVATEWTRWLVSSLFSSQTQSNTRRPFSPWWTCMEMTRCHWFDAHSLFWSQEKYGPWVQGDAEESPLVSGPGRCEHSVREVEEGAVDPGAVGQIHPHVSQLLRHEESMSPIICVDHGHRVTEPVGNLLQAQLQTPLGIFTYNSEVRIQLWGERNPRRKQEGENQE